MERSEIPYDTRHLRVPSGASNLIYEHMVRSMQIVHLSCVKISTISKQTKPSLHLSLFSSSTIGCVQISFLGYGALGINRTPILH